MLGAQCLLCPQPHIGPGVFLRISLKVGSLAGIGNSMHVVLQRQHGMPSSAENTCGGTPKMPN